MPRDNGQLVAGTVQNVAEAMVEMREVIEKRPPPQVTVHVPETAVTVKVPENIPPNMHFNFPAQAAPEVRFEVPQQPPPTVNIKQPTINVLPPEPRAYNCVVTSRDENGFILSFTVTPM